MVIATTFPTPAMVQVADILNTVLISNPIIFINLWSIGHLLFGFILMRMFLVDRKDRFIKLFGLLVLYEILELTFIFFGSTLFRPELYIDQLYDLIIGMLGGYLATKWIMKSI